MKNAKFLLFCIILDAALMNCFDDDVMYKRLMGFGIDAIRRTYNRESIFRIKIYKGTILSFLF